MFVIWIMILFTYVSSRCQQNEISESELEKTHEECPLKYSSHYAGLARNVRAECKQNNDYRQFFYYQISWDQPEFTGTPVIGYRVYIMYSANTHACFQLPASEHSFVFKRSVGLAYGCHFYYSVTPQPISLIDGNRQTPLHLVLGCPIGVKLLPLPNIYVQPESSFTFTAQFEEAPVPGADVAWYFSSDRKFCKNRQRVKEDSQEMKLLENNLVLKIVTASRKHIGCYVVTAENGIGRKQEQRGYMDLNITSTYLSAKKEKHIMEVIEGPLFAAIAAILVVMVVVAFALTIHWNRASKKRKQNDEEKLLSTKIYISHCMQDDAEKSLLFQFSSALNANGLDVLLDVCSTVEINNVGGLNRWIPLQMIAAKKVLIIVNQQYLSELQSTSVDVESGQRDNFYQKLYAEITAINKAKNDGKKNSNDILLLCFGVEDKDLIHPLDTFRTAQFPEGFDLESNLDFKYIINTLVDR